MDNNNENKSELYLYDKQTVEKRNINISFSIILFFLSIACLVFSILYYNLKYNQLIVNSVDSKDFTIKNFSGFNFNKISKFSSDSVSIENAEFDSLENDKTFVTNLISTQTDVDTMTIYENDISSKVRFNTQELFEYVNYPAQFGFIAFKFNCIVYDSNSFPCQISNYFTKPNVNQQIYLNNQSQLYHFKNKVPPCVLWDTISDQLVDSNCTSKCESVCQVMKDNCESFATNETLKNITTDTVSVYKKSSPEILDMTVSLSNFSSNNCFLFGNGVVSDDIVSDNYSESVHTVFFGKTYELNPFVEVYITSTSGISNIKNRVTSAQWKDKYKSLVNNNDYIYCFYNNLDSLVYPQDVISGTTRVNFSVGVTTVTPTYFQFKVSTNYGYKLNSGYVVKYNIYEISKK